MATPEEPTKVQIIYVLIAGGIGGLLPTLVKLAPIYVQAPDTPLPQPGLYLGLSIFFLLGAVVTVISKESDFRKAVILGIAAPGIVSSYISGKDEGAQAASSAPTATRTIDISDALAGLFGVSAAHAQVAVEARSIAPRLTIVPRIAGTRKLYSIAPVTVEFIGNDGSILTSQQLDPRLTTTVSVPIGARLVRTKSSGSQSNTLLPKTSYSAAELNLLLGVAKGNDLWWALGGTRTTKLESIQSNLSNVRQGMPFPPRMSVEKGTPVVDASGARVGEIASITREPGKPSTVVLSSKP